MIDKINLEKLRNALSKTCEQSDKGKIRCLH